MFLWKKHGNVFNPTVDKPRAWMQSHSQCPFPFVLDAQTVRVYITTRGERDAEGQFVSYPGFVDLDRADLRRVTRIAEQPLMPLGGPGTYDEFGITPSSFLRRESDLVAYFTGWSRMRSVPYTMAIGMAVSRDGGDTFEKLGEGPILGPTLNEPYLLSGPVVRRVDDLWHMWYLSGRGWVRSGDKFESVYQIAHATSTDGVVWTRDGRPILPTLSTDECQVSFALFPLEGRWHTLFAYRQPVGFRTDPARAYRLGYAWSDDLETWHRDDSHVGIDVSETGWDSQMMCYPQVLEADGRITLFYCGNDFGREGFGTAELIDYSAPR